MWTTVDKRRSERGLCDATIMMSCTYEIVDNGVRSVQTIEQPGSTLRLIEVALGPAADDVSQPLEVVGAVEGDAQHSAFVAELLHLHVGLET